MRERLGYRLKALIVRAEDGVPVCRIRVRPVQRISASGAYAWSGYADQSVSYAVATRDPVDLSPEQAPLLYHVKLGEQTYTIVGVQKQEITPLRSNVTHIYETVLLLN